MNKFTLSRKTIFWVGCILVSAGMAMQLPMYFHARNMGYRLVGMPMDSFMIMGMIGMVIGLVLTIMGLIPEKSAISADYNTLQVRALDDVPIRWPHIALLFVMALAMTLDVMKPTILSFVVPGAAIEYGLKSPINPHARIPVALLPLCGISGTIMGSFIWGWMSDRMGRRASILMAAVVFIATSACGAMPEFWMNCLMCLIMGFGVGGMLPILFTLMAECIPARHRGWLMVLIGGDIAGAYLITSSLASWLVPHYNWRILWLIGFPTGILLILLNHWIPESPRFLLLHGRVKEAEKIMKKFGAAITSSATEGPEMSANSVQSASSPTQFRDLFSTPFRGITSAVVLLAIGAGFVRFGFQLWIPSNLQELGFSQQRSFAILRNAALIGFPLNFLIAWMYGFWSSKRTIILLSALTAASMIGFLIAGNHIVQHPLILYVLLILPIWGVSAIMSVLSAYAAEIYPTAIRSRGSGLISGMSQIAGVFIIALVVLAVAPPSITATALIAALPLLLAVITITLMGIETRKRSLEDITAEELQPAYQQSGNS
ncbi:MFS transporter [Thermoflavifilum thermophilum]|uniref:MFS transporter, putative metabolite:H+ symporter n=1 Tax=Thermoflavifilum thermophilum TaxID=1393122 RepID=A0A1I7N8S0_9BACT|nr:MFS transporter [Thermoflavifilum thermophilum]SFV31038.1 MFS transporter, putative metabolite:H+ symporter [Thermoflavifilum thermophilum]